jgi:hypothetical protein
MRCHRQPSLSLTHFDLMSRHVLLVAFVFGSLDHKFHLKHAALACLLLFQDEMLR